MGLEIHVCIEGSGCPAVFKWAILNIRAVGGSILTAGKKLSEKSECNNLGYNLTWWP